MVTYFHGMLLMETLGGKTTDTDLEVKEGFFAKKIGENAELALGRFMTDVGFGTLGGAPYMDGGKLAFGKDVKVTLYSARFGSEGLVWRVPDGHGGWVPISNTAQVEMPHYTFNHGDIKFNFNKDLKMSVAYFADNNTAQGYQMYDSKAVGLEYKGIPKITLTGEYGVNSADVAKTANANETAKAYFIKAKYKGANPFMVGSSGFWVMYKKADPGFDLMGMASPFVWNAPFNYTTPSGGGMAENMRGFEFGYEAAIAKRMIFKATYNDLKRVAADPTHTSLASADDQSFFTAQVTYIF